MMEIVLIIPAGETSALAVTGITMVFDVANMIAGPQFNVRIASHMTTREVKLGRYGIRIDSHLNEVEQADLVIYTPFKSATEGRS